MFEKLLNLVYPKRCFWCMKKINENISYTCEKCSNILKYRLNESLDVSIYDRHFERLITCFLYKDDIRKKVLEFKFSNKPFLGKIFAKSMVDILVEKKITADLIIPVPMHYTKYYERGYNQSEILAKYISKELGIKYNTRVLKKIKKTRVQSTLNAIDRRNNVMNTYAVKRKNKIYGKTILLIDDIYTTGATVNECSKVLKENDVGKIIVVTIARGKLSKEEF